MNKIKEYDKKINEYKIKLSEYLNSIDFKPVELVELDDFDIIEPLLYYDLREEALFLLEQHNIKINDLSIGYSLSHSQGDGFNFVGHFEFKRYKNYNVRIEKSPYCRYEHSKSTNIYIEDEKGEEAREDIYKYFEDIYFNVCDKCKESGYSIIEEEYTRQQVFYTISKKADFLESYDLENEYIELKEEDLSNDKYKEYVKLFYYGTYSGDKFICIRDFDLNIKEFTNTTVKEYKVFE